MIVVSSWSTHNSNQEPNCVCLTDSPPDVSQILAGESSFFLHGSSIGSIGFSSIQRVYLKFEGTVCQNKEILNRHSRRWKSRLSEYMINYAMTRYRTVFKKTSWDWSGLEYGHCWTVAQKYPLVAGSRSARVCSRSLNEIQLPGGSPVRHREPTLSWLSNMNKLSPSDKTDVVKQLTDSEECPVIVWLSVQTLPETSSWRLGFNWLAALSLWANQLLSSFSFTSSPTLSRQRHNFNRLWTECGCQKQRTRKFKSCNDLLPPERAPFCSWCRNDNLHLKHWLTF